VLVFGHRYEGPHLLEAEARTRHRTY
jgi:hypothetical protein